jgi:glycerol kinase
MGDALLVIQQTATSLSAWVIDREGEILARREIGFPLSHVSDDRLEVDAHDASLIGGEVLDSVLETTDPARIAGVAMVAQTGFTMLWERSGSRPFTPVVVRDDVRGQELCRSFRARGFDEPFRIRTGRIPVGQAAGFKLSVLLSDIPKALHRAALGELCFGTLNTFLIWRLSGSRIHAIDRTDAAETMLFNLERLDWDSELLEVFNVPAACLPVVYPPAFVYTETTLGSRLPNPIPLAAAVAEPQAVVYGCGVVNPGQALVYLDDTVHIKAITGKERAPTAKRSDLACDAEGRTQFMEPVTLLHLGRLQSWAEALGLPDTMSQLEKLATRDAPQADLVFVGEEPEHASGEANSNRARFLQGLKADTTDSQIARSLFTALSHRIRLALEGLASPAVKSLTIDGPHSGSSLAAQSLADVTGIPVTRFTSGHSAVSGAVELARLTLGWKSGLADLRNQTIIRPASKAAERKAGAKAWQRALQTST